MKTIFTLLFSLGLLTTAFAQDGRHHRDFSQSPSYGYQGYGNNPMYQAIPYANGDDWYNNRREEDRFDRWNSYGDGDNLRRRFRDRDDDHDRMERWHHDYDRHWRRHRRELSISFGNY